MLIPDTIYFYKFYAGQQENEMSSTASKSMLINPDIYPWTCPSKQKVQVQHCFHRKAANAMWSRQTNVNNNQ